MDPILKECLIYLLPFIYIIPTFILYFCILYSIFFCKSKTKFAGSFYKLFGFSAIIYIIHSITYFIVIRMSWAKIFLPFFKLLPQKSFTLTLLFMALYYTANAIHFYSLCLSFNRFSVFILKVKTQKFWKKYMKYFLGFCLFVPLLTVWHLPFTGVEIVLENSTDPNRMRYFTQINRKNIPWMSNSLILLITISITSILSLLMNLYVIFQLIKHRLWYKFQRTQKFSSQDLKMFGYSMLIFATEIISCIQQYAFYSIKDLAITNEMFYLQFFVVDAVTLAPAWFFLFTNKSLKKEIKKCFLCILVPINAVFPPQNVTPSSTF